MLSEFTAFFADLADNIDWEVCFHDFEVRVIIEEDEYGRAVFFFDREGQISKQMNIGEFQAVLDGYVPSIGLEPGSWRAVYLEIDEELVVRRSVFFLLPVMPSGSIEPSWAMPLMHLAESAAKARKIGGELIQIACYSQCPIAHLRKMLWDPDLSPSNNQLSAVRKAVTNNRLGLQFMRSENDDKNLSQSQKDKFEKEISERLRLAYSQELRDRMAQLLKGQRLRTATLRNEYNRRIREFKIEYENRIDEYRDFISEKTRLADEQRELNKALKATVDGQAQKISGMREYFDAKLQSAAGMDESSLDNYREALVAEMEAKFESEMKDMKETLQMREVELLYRNELEIQLHDEIARLREENQSLMTNTGEDLLGTLIAKGISLVTYQPGAGHLTIPVNEVSRFLESPTAYAAEHCGVNEQRYGAWLDHYHMPVCKESLEDGSFCGENIDRIENPLDFHIGESDCCTSCRKRLQRAHLRLASS